MQRSGTMDFVYSRAEAEAKHGGRARITVEDVFLGILKLSEMKAEEIIKAPAIILDVTNVEIRALKTLLEEGYKVDTTQLRGLLRRTMIHMPPGVASTEEKLESYKDRAKEIAAERKSEQYFPGDMLRAIVENPTYILMQVCDILNWSKPKDEDAEDKASKDETPKVGKAKKDDEKDRKKPDGEEIPYDGKRPEKPQNVKIVDGMVQADDEEVKAHEMSPDFLSELTDRIRRLRAKLLGTVKGQDHVVHAFAEGLFAAEVLAAGDENRKRPRAIFAFVGPPGVGKTFLAEQAAEELNMPFKRFDMSTYSDHQSYMGLVGWEKSYQAAAEGQLTGFVAQFPHCILLFDEIEKAHLNTLQLFLQILDAGRLSDRYTGLNVSFKDTIIIFTSNAGKSLYEGENRQNAAGVSRKVLLKALETEKDPRTGSPFFPGAITSRLATGWPILFNHLPPHDLEKISAREISRFGEIFEKQYSIKSDFDELLPAALLYREGGAVDARTLRAQTELFFKNEIFKVCRLWSGESFEEVVRKLERISFRVEADSMTEETRPLFFPDCRAEILIYGDPAFAARCRKELPGYIFYDTCNVDEALAIAGEKDIRLVLLDITEKSQNPEALRGMTGNSGDADSLQATVYDNRDILNNNDLLLSAGAFDFAPMSAGAFRDGGGLFRKLRERLPELPVYLLETPDFVIDEELTMSFVRAGARGKLTAPVDEFTVFEDILSQVSRELYMQGVAAALGEGHKYLHFETAPKLSEDQTEVGVRLRDFSLKRAAESEDAGSMLKDAEKPDTGFDDVIGAADAKDELRFFVDYLKNPKKFTAQGLKPPKGVLLYGPPGTGKTMLARAMAGESDVAFIPTNASNFVNKYAGSGPAAIRELFQRARRYAPAVVFIDEIDAIGRKRLGGISGHSEETTLNSLLSEMDGFGVDPKRPVFVLAATNFAIEAGGRGIGELDPALVRRFDRRILVDLPDETDREKLLSVLVGKNPANLVSKDMLHRLAERSVGMSPANLTDVIELANRMAIKAGKPVDDEILEEAFELTKHGEKKDWGYEYLERVARHESGHAFLCYLGGNTPAYLTIVARGEHGGYMEHSAKEMGPLATREELINRIRTSLGGRAAEIVYYGEKNGLSTGAAGDLENATKLAAAMICSYGMDEDFGLAYMDPKEAMKDPEIRKKVNMLLGGEMRATVEILQKNRTRIDHLVSELMKKNKLTDVEIEELLRD